MICSREGAFRSVCIVLICGPYRTLLLDIRPLSILL